MCKKVFYTEFTSYVFISANTEEQCNKRASKYFNTRGHKKFVEVNNVWN